MRQRAEIAFETGEAVLPRINGRFPCKFIFLERRGLAVSHEVAGLGIMNERDSSTRHPHLQKNMAVEGHATCRRLRRPTYNSARRKLYGTLRQSFVGEGI